jgi:hypothetical protein
VTEVDLDRTGDHQSRDPRAVDERPVAAVVLEDPSEDGVGLQGGVLARSPLVQDDDVRASVAADAYLTGPVEACLGTFGELLDQELA